MYGVTRLVFSYRGGRWPLSSARLCLHGTKLLFKSLLGVYGKMGETFGMRRVGPMLEVLLRKE